MVDFLLDTVQLIFQFLHCKNIAGSNRYREVQEFCGTFEFQFLIFRYPELDDVSFVVRRVVVLGIARGRLNIRFGHYTSCLFDNSSVKLCKHDTPFVRAIRREL